MRSAPTRATLDVAIDIQRRAYRLLRWLEGAIERGFISLDAAHDYTRFADTARLWIERHYADIPPDARPPRERLPEFANYFASFTRTSFDLVDEPGKRLYSPRAHCFCPFCSWLVDVPRLQPKRLTKGHKREAVQMLTEYLSERALEHDRLLDDDELAVLVADPELREQLALCVYADELLMRMTGNTKGPAVLALWRMFAWTPAGSPRKGFELSVDQVLDARTRVLTRLR